MSRIRCDNTGPELAMMSELEALGVRYDYQPKIPGRPDFLITGYNITLFIDGCFWHGCPIHYTEPRTNRRFWRNKIENNRKRKYKVNRMLRKLGYRVIRLWEHQLG